MSLSSVDLIKFSNISDSCNEPGVKDELLKMAKLKKKINTCKTALKDPSSKFQAESTTKGLLEKFQNFFSKISYGGSSSKSSSKRIKKSIGGKKQKKSKKKRTIRVKTRLLTKKRRYSKNKSRKN